MIPGRPLHCRQMTLWQQIKTSNLKLCSDRPLAHCCLFTPDSQNVLHISYKLASNWRTDLVCVILSDWTHFSFVISLQSLSLYPSVCSSRTIKQIFCSRCNIFNTCWCVFVSLHFLSELTMTLEEHCLYKVLFWIRSVWTADKFNR